MRALLVTLLLVAAAAGCIAPQAPPTEPPVTQTPDGGEMTAKETRDESATLCTDSLNLAGEDRFCAVRTITVEGTISGVPKMDVALTTFNGPVTLTPSSEGQWGFKATLKARGASAEEAKAKLDDIQFEWSHVENGAHFLQATAKKDGESSGDSAMLEATLPKSIVYVLVATTSNGAVKVDGLKTDGLSAQTSNGAVDVNAAVTQVDLTTSNGPITAKLDPTSSGRVSLTTSNGRLALSLPEDARRGYDLEGTTSNGKVDVTLRDGRVGDCPQGSQYYTPPCTHRTFQTSGFASRAAQVRVSLTTSNGDVSVGPA